MLASTRGHFPFPHDIRLLFRLDHRLDFWVVLEGFQRLLLRHLHLLDLFFQQQLGAFVLQRAQPVPLGRIRVFMEKNHQRQEQNKRSDAYHQQHRALVDKLSERGTSRDSR